MRIRLLAFASAADALGAEERVVEVPDGTTVIGLRRWLGEQVSGLRPLLPRLAVAVEGEVVGDEVTLREGVEVALLPPVSGGDAPAAWLTEEPLDPSAIAALVGGSDCGAVVLFVGTVRDRHQGRAVTRLTYTAYRPMAEQRLRALAAELGLAHGARVAIAHRLGTLLPGEVSVVIAVAAPHREAAYSANRACLERLKRVVPVWKREHYAEGDARWREEEPLRAAEARGSDPSAAPRP